MKFKVALQVYSVRDDASKDLRGTLRRIKEMGYHGVEFAGLYGNAPADIKAMLDEIGLFPISAHVPIDDLLADPDGVIDGYALIGCPYIAIPYLPEQRRPGSEGFEQTLRDIAAIAKAVKKRGMHLLYHNHDFEFESIDGEYALDILYRTIPADLLGTQIDTCWVNVAGVNPAAYIRKYAGRAPVVHLKDFHMGSRTKGAALYELIGDTATPRQPRSTDFEFRPVGYGVQEFPEILRASEEAGAQWVVVEQDMPSMGKSALECAQMSIDTLKKLGIL
ncbi:MAG: sugar phosphate isomerase/epimerase family protein [Christensenellales bacterium]|jgi:sugar phosphate isomerase/epimerase